MAVLLSTAAWGVDEIRQATGKKSTFKATRMRAAGVVTEISATILKIERKVKDKAETMEFALEKPLEKIKVGDKVRVSYITTAENQNLATRVTANIPQKFIKKPKVEGKTTPVGGVVNGK